MVYMGRYKKANKTGRFPKTVGLHKKEKKKFKKIIFQINKILLYWIYWYILIYTQYQASYTS